MNRLLILLLAVISASASAQNWSSILNSSRAVDWSGAGVTGGIPDAAWTQCGSTVAAGASAATIQSAINSCTATHYVLLGSGTFNLSSGLNMKAGVVLRGSGANSTFLVFSGGVPCGGQGAQICFLDSSGYYYGGSNVAIGSPNSATFCGTAGSGACNNTYTTGATTIQLSNVGTSKISNGQYIYLDQQNDSPASASTVTSGMLVCDTATGSDSCSLEGGAPGRTSNGVDRSMVQIVKVVSGCTSGCTGAGPFNVTITPGLYGKKWTSSLSPGAWWSANDMQNAGLENLSIDSTAVGTSTESGIYFNNAFNCWANNVRSMKPNRNHVWLWQSAHNTIENSYFFGTQNAASQSYGVESYIASDNLIINNVFQQVTAPVMMGPSMGSVYAYNFSVNDTYYVTAWMQQAFAWGHDAGAMYNLSEGNITSGYWSDVFHGTGGANTVFRNYASGWEPGKSEDTAPYQQFSYNRFGNVVGNVLGCKNTTASYPGNCGNPYHTTYQTNGGVGQAASIYDLNAGNSASGVTVQADPYVTTSLMRWGNYDVVNNATRWVSSEVPSGLSDGYAVSVPSSQTLPSSFFTNSQPSWWGSVPWPGIGPDVTGGNIPGVSGHAYLNPAANCYLTTMSGPVDGTGNVLGFDASQCYASSGTGSGTQPGSPSGLTVIVK